MTRISSARDLLRQLKSLGKLLVKEDIHNFSFDSLHHWQYGIVLWYFSELLSLVDFFFPFDKQIEKTLLKNKINNLQKLQEEKRLEYAKQQVAQNYKRSSFRRIRRRNSQVYG